MESSKKEDPRSLKSKEALLSALANELTERPIELVSITSICKRA